MGTTEAKRAFKLNRVYIMTNSQLLEKIANKLAGDNFTLSNLKSESLKLLSLKHFEKYSYQLNKNELEDLYIIATSLVNLRNEVKDLQEKYIAFSEYELIKDDFLLVEISNFKEGIFVNADFEKECFFSGEIEIYPTGFYLPFDLEYTTDLYPYLEQIDQEILEGYILPNKLYKD